MIEAQKYFPNEINMNKLFKNHELTEFLQHNQIFIIMEINAQHGENLPEEGLSEAPIFAMKRINGAKIQNIATTNPAPSVAQRRQKNGSL